MSVETQPNSPTTGAAPTGPEVLGQSELRERWSKLQREFENLKNRLASQARESSILADTDETNKQIAEMAKVLEYDFETVNKPGIEPIITDLETKLSSLVQSTTKLEQAAPRRSEKAETETLIDDEQQGEQETNRAFERVQAHNTLGTLATEANPSCDSALNQRIEKALENIRYGDVDPAPIRIAIVKKLQPEWQGNATEAEKVIAEHITGLQTEQQKKDFDLLARKAAVDHLLEQELGGFRSKLDAIEKDLEAKEKTKADEKAQKRAKFGKALLGLAKVSGGVFAGIVTKNALINAFLSTAGGQVASHGLNVATRVLSGGAGAIAGGLVGGTLGGLRAYGQARAEGQALKNIRERVKEQNLNAADEARIINELLEQRQLRIESPDELAEIKELINSAYKAEVKAELEAALAIVDRDRMAETRAPDVNLARALTALLKSHTEGSEHHRGENVQKYLKDNYWELRGKLYNKAVTKETAKGAAISGAIGATIGGFFGVMWPPASLFAKVNAEAVVQLKSHFTGEGASQALNQFLHGSRDITGLNLKDAQYLFEHGQADLGRKIIEHNHDINMGVDYGNHNLTEWVKDLTSKVHGEDGLRMLHHILSHPQETVGQNGIDTFVKLAATEHGRHLTDLIVHGFQGGTSEPAMIASIREYLQKTHREYLQQTHMAGKNWAEGLIPFRGLGSEKDIQDFIAFFLISGGAQYFKEFGETAFGWFKKKKEEETEAKEKQDKEPTSPEFTGEKSPAPTRYYTVTPELIKLTEKDDPSREELKKLGEFVEAMENLHGSFFILPGENGGQPKICRIWTLATEKANPTLGNTDIHDPDRQNVSGQGPATRRDRGILQHGKIHIKVYDNFEDFYRGPDKNGNYQPSTDPRWENWLTTFDRPAWKTEDPEPHNVGIKEVFTNNDLGQLFISPHQVELYLHAIMQDHIHPGNPIPPGTDPDKLPGVTSAEVAAWIAEQDKNKREGGSSLRENNETVGEDRLENEGLEPELEIVEKPVEPHDTLISKNIIIDRAPKKLSELTVRQLELVRGSLEKKLEAVKKTVVEGSAAIGGTGAVELDIDSVNYWINEKNKATEPSIPK